MATNTSSPQQEANVLEEDDDIGNDEEVNNAIVPESHRQDLAYQDTVVFTTDESEEEPFNTAIGDTSDDPAIVMGKPITIAFISDDVHIPTEKVGCSQVTSQLQEFLNHFPPESIEIDLCNFLAIWTVLCILLDTKSNKLQYIKNLQ